MGLDITAYAIPSGASEGEQFHYWRKHHELLKWCEALDMVRGGKAWEEPAQGVDLTSADLDKLEIDVLKGALPSHWRAHDLAFILKAREVIAAGMTVEIVFSW